MVGGGELQRVAVQAIRLMAGKARTAQMKVSDSSSQERNPIRLSRFMKSIVTLDQP